MSKGLEALERLFENDYHKPLKYIIRHRDRQTIEKELKALNILKNHCIENWKIRISKNYKEYIDEYVNSCTEYISEEEYNLLKEVLL